MPPFVGSPLILLEAPEIIYENQRISFNCSAPADVVSYRWFREGAALPAESDETLEVVVTAAVWNGSCLTCVARWGNGTEENASTTLTVVGE